MSTPNKPNKATVQDIVDGISGGTANLFKKTETELYKQRLQLESLYKQSPLAAKIEEGFREASAAAKNAKESVEKISKVAASDVLKNPEKFRANFIQRSLNDLKNWTGKNIIQPISKELTNRVVKPTEKLFRPVTKSLEALPKQVDKAVGRTLDGLLKPFRAANDKILKTTASLARELPEIASAAKSFGKMVARLTKILPWIGLLVDLFSANAIFNAIEAQRVQLKKLDAIDVTTVSINNRLTKVIIDVSKIQSRLDSIAADIRSQGKGGSAKNEVKLSAQDIAEIAALVAGQIKPAAANNQQIQIGNQLTSIQAKLSQIQAQQPKVDLSPVTGQLTSIQAKLSQIQAPKVDFSPVTSQLTAIQTRLSQPTQAKVDLSPVTAKIDQLSLNLSQPKVDLSSVNARLDQLQAKLAQPPIYKVDFTPVSAQLNRIEAKSTQPPEVNLTPVLGAIAGVSAGVVVVNAGINRLNTKLEKPLVAPTDLNPVLNRLNQVDQGVISNGAKISQVEKGLKPIPDLVKTVNVVDDKLGEKIPNGGIGGKLTRVAKWLQLDRILNILTWINTLHNAYMLSNALGQTLFSMIGNVLKVFGFQDDDNNALDIGKLLGNSIEGASKTVLGNETTEEIKTVWKKASRIYQATANLLQSLQSITFSILSALESIGSMNAKIGNALRKWGTVGEKAYGWMNPTPNYDNRFFTSLERVENVASTIDSIASDTLSARESFEQISKQKEDLDKALRQDEGAKQGKESVEAAKVKSDADKSKSDSTSTAIPPEAERKPEA